jgi:hypothetical protein
MSSTQVRPFRRSDRDQLTRLVNAHAQAVVPGLSASVNTVLASLEGQPGEFIEDPWVAERVTLVAEQQNRVAAAAHLLRYFPDERAGQDFRDAGEIRWLLYWSETPAGNPYWPDSAPAGRSLVTACLAQLADWAVTSPSATGARASGRGCSGRRPTGSSWVTSTGCWITPGSRGPIPAGSATRTTGPSSRRWASASSPEPSAAGPAVPGLARIDSP